MIIGIIAAITIPALNNNIRAKQFQSQTKAAMSLLNQAVDKASTLDFSNTPRCHYWINTPSHHCSERNERGECTKYVMADGSPLASDVNGSAADCALLMQSMLKYLNVVKFCQNSSYANGCIGKYLGIDTILKANNSSISDYDTAAATSGCANFREASIRNNLSAYVLANNMIIIPYSTGSAKLLLIDVNGKHGPNKWGYDLHVFQLRSDYESPQYYPGGCEQTEKGGKSTADMIAGK